jgi:hypothetical protein
LIFGAILRNDVTITMCWFIFTLIGWFQNVGAEKFPASGALGVGACSPWGGQGHDSNLENDGKKKVNQSF